MESIVIEPTVLAQWHKLVQEAAKNSNHKLDHELEHYLVNVLIRCSQRPNICSKALADDYLNACSLMNTQKSVKLQDVGDQCLMLTGFWPKRAQKRLVDVGYYVRLGRSSYLHAANGISAALGELYRQISQAFVELMDVLASMRDMTQPQLCLLSEIDTWQQTGSAYSLAKIGRDQPQLALSLHQSINSVKKH